MTISYSISIPGGLKSFMLKNCKVDFLGKSEVAFFFIHPVFSMRCKVTWDLILILLLTTF
jgi:hypothetical protein